MTAPIMSERTREREGAGERAAHPVQPQCVFDFSVETHTDTHLELQSAKRQQHKTTKERERDSGRDTSLTPETAAGLETKKGERTERQHVFSL